MFKKTMTVAAIAGALTLGVSSPAFASQSTDLGSRIVAGGTSTGVLLNGSLEVVYECTVAATGPVVSVAITGCKPTTGGVSQKIALPGPTATVAGVAALPLSPYSLCYSAVATYADSSTRSVSGCTSLVPSTGGLTPTTGVTVN
jgi:hypothetical protein